MKKRDAVSFVLRALAPLLIAFSVWWPDFNEFRIERVVPSDTLIETLSREPSSNELADSADVDLHVSLGIQLENRANAAASIFRGQLNAPSFLSSPYQLQGWPNDLAPGGPTFQLVLASLAVEDLLLKEYQSGGDRRYYRLARDRILAFAEWESRQRKPIAFLWNDHAIAARISVLIRLWSDLRNDAETTPAHRAELIALVQRSGELLAKESQFTVRTNHGVMQNLALLQITAAFPSLPNTSQWRSLAIERLDLQLRFYVSDEGIVLEHSAEYHEFGNQLLSDALKLARLNQFAPSKRLLDAYAGTTDFLRLLRRPDGSLPLVGNTAGGIHAPMSTDYAAFTNEAGSSIYPLSGYAIWWGAASAISQTTVAWAKHDRHGHKHADEPSVHFWSRGIDWVTATGYWPYGARGYEQANGWSGSNAPHASGEGFHSPRTVKLLGSAESGSIRGIDIENARQSGLVVRRQIIQLSPDQLLVLDAVRGAALPIETLWTLDTRLKFETLGGQQFRTNPAESGHFLQVELATENDTSLQTALYRGSWLPFAGWVVEGREPTPASALRVSRPPGDSLTATLFTVSDRFESRAIKLLAGAQSDNWTIEIQASAGGQRIRRTGDDIEVKNSLGTTNLKLTEPASLALRQESLTNSMNKALDAYPPWRELGFYHQRIYYAVAGLWATVEIMLAFMAWRRLRRAWMDVAVLTGWVSFGWWIHAVYLV